MRVDEKGTEEASKRGMIQEQCYGLSVAIDHLGEVTDDLGEKLVPVLREEPESESGLGNDLGITCPLAEQIHGYERRVNHITETLIDYLQRLEV